MNVDASSGEILQWSGETAKSKCLPCKHKGLSGGHWHPHVRKKQLLGPVTPILRGQERSKDRRLTGFCWQSS